MPPSVQISRPWNTKRYRRRAVILESRRVNGCDVDGSALSDGKTFSSESETDQAGLPSLRETTPIKSCLWEEIKVETSPFVQHFIAHFEKVLRCARKASALARPDAFVLVLSYLRRGLSATNHDQLLLGFWIAMQMI